MTAGSMTVPAPHALAASEPTAGPWSTADRIAELHDLAILDTEPEPLYDDLVRVAAHVCRAPVALVSLVDAQRQWFKSEVGLGKRELPIDCSVCAHTIEAGDLLMYPRPDRRSADHREPAGHRDAGLPLLRRRGDPRRAGHPAGCPLRARPDAAARTGSTPAQSEPRWHALARQISNLLEQRRTLAQVAAREAELAASERRFRVMTSAMPQMVWTTLPDGFHDYYNDRWYEFTGVPYGSTDGAGWNDMFHPDDQERAWTRWRHSLATGEPYEIEYRLRHHSGAYRWTLGPRHADPRRRRADRALVRDLYRHRRPEAGRGRGAQARRHRRDLQGLHRPVHAGRRGSPTSTRRPWRWSGCPTSPPRAATGWRISSPTRAARLLADTAMPAVRRDGYWEGELAFRHVRHGRAGGGPLQHLPGPRCDRAPRSATPPSPGTCARRSAPRRPATC